MRRIDRNANGRTDDPPNPATNFPGDDAYVQLVDSSMSVVAHVDALTGELRQRMSYDAFGRMRLILNADIDGNGRVDEDDLSIFATQYTYEVGDEERPKTTDFNGDGVVDDGDLSLFAQWYDDQTGDKPARDAVRVAYHGYIPEHATLMYIGDETRMTRYLGRMRWYDARLGRWLTRDPAGYVDGLNVYLFVGGNPLMFVDPTGLFLSAVAGWVANTASDAWDGAKEVGSFVVTGGGNLAAEANQAASEENLYGRNVGANAKALKERGDAAGSQAAMAAGAQVSNAAVAAVAAIIEERAEASVDIVMTAAGGGGKLVSAAADVAQVAVDISNGQSPVASFASLLPGVSSGSVNAAGGLPTGAAAQAMGGSVPVGAAAVFPKLTHMPDFDQAREEAFKRAGLTDPSKVQFTKYCERTGTVVEFKSTDGGKVAYDGPHKKRADESEEDWRKAGHDKPHVGWQTPGKRPADAQRGNITYSGEQHPSRSNRKPNRR